jgi:hypothetical protein
MMPGFPRGSELAVRSCFDGTEEMQQRSARTMRMKWRLDLHCCCCGEARLRLRVRRNAFEEMMRLYSCSYYNR